MAQELQSKFRKIKLFPALVVAGTIVTTFIQAASAQITPDNTLGNESSRVLPDTTVRGAAGTLIDGGATRGVNLFHSFSQFNVGNGERVYFANPTGINNILTRVTGNNASNIFGTLGVDGNANLFLLNPNGIVFGQNAQLDVSGSFFVTTANSFVFENGLQYSAVNPEAPPLLTVNLTPGLQFGANSGNITSNANLSVGGNLTLAAGNLDLQGEFASQGLNLEAQDTANIGTILAPGVSVNITAGNKITTTGQINTSINRGRGGDIQLTSGIGGIDTRGGDITAGSDNGNGGNITLSTTGDIFTAGVRSFVSPGGIGNGGNITITSTNGKIDTTLGNINSSTALGLAGSISLNANGNITTGNVGSFVIDGGIGNGGNITIVSTNGDINTTGFVNSSAFGTLLDLGTGNQFFGGIAGNISLSAKGDITTRDVGSYIGAGGIGNGGNITITSTNGDINTTGFVNSSAFGAFLDLGAGNQLFGGIAGDISLNASGNITTRDVGSYISAGGIGQAGRISIISQDGGINTTGGNIESSSEGGFSGDIYLESKNNISTGNLRSSSKLGNGGNIHILSMEGKIDTKLGSINSRGQGFKNIENSDNSIIGNSGNISLDAVGDITTGNITSSTNFGRAGNIDLISRNGIVNTTKGDINSSTDFGIAGNIVLNANNKITTGNVNSSSKLGYGGSIDILSNTNGIDTTAGSINSTGQGLINLENPDNSIIGNSGNISLNATGNINTGNITSSTNFGVAGNINVISQTGKINTTAGNINSSTMDGLGGLINLSAVSNNITVGNLLAYSTEISESGGINIFSGGEFSVSNALITTETSGTGRGGDITIEANSVSLNNVNVVSSTFGTGDAGKVTINTNGGTVTLDNARIFSTIENGANVPLIDENNDKVGIQINTGKLELKNGAQLQTLVRGSENNPIAIPAKGNAGSVYIIADEVTLEGKNDSGFSSGIFSNLGTGAEGTAGNIGIIANKVSLTGGTLISSNTYGSGNAGNIILLANDSVSLNGSGTTISTTADSSNLRGNAGGILISSQEVRVENGAEIKVDNDRVPNSTTPLIPQSSSPTQQNSDTVNQSNNTSETGGNSPPARAGVVLVIADRLFLNDGKITATSQEIDGGNIFLNVRELLLMGNNSLISAQARGQGNGGNVFINRDEILEGYRGFVIALNDGSKQPPYTGNDIIASAENGDGGNVVINTQSLFGFGVRKANSRNEVIQRQTVADENEEYEQYPSPYPNPDDSRASNQTNDIDVSSERGLQGEVLIKTLVVDPSSGLISLPDSPTDPSKQIVPACDAGDGQFTNTGRGGLPPNPNQPLSGDNVWEDTRVNVSGGQSQAGVTGDSPDNSGGKVVSIIPANGWVMDGKGQVMLVNQAGNDAGLKEIPGVSSSCRPVR